MRYIALATDYDGTLAESGKVHPDAVAALEKLRKSGRRLLLVSGRELHDLRSVFERLDLFDRVVVENGALLYRPESREDISLTEPISEKFVEALRAEGVPFSVGRGIVATLEPYQEQVMRVIRELGLELHVVFNKGAVMVLPSGVNKATGLSAALLELQLSAHNVVGIGDAENDHALLASCELSVAVANALPALKERADVVTRGERGAGVIEIIDQLLEDDLRRYDERIARHRVIIGEVAGTVSGTDHQQIFLPGRGSVLIAGPSGSGKSTHVSGLLERMAGCHYQFCLIDPEGDYDDIPDAVVVGSVDGQPNPDTVLKALSQSSMNVVVNLLAIPLADRPRFFSGLLGRLLELRASTARPHWLVVDEAHHMFPPPWAPENANLTQILECAILITVHPDQVSVPVLREIDMAIAVGRTPEATFQSLAKKIGAAEPSLPSFEWQENTAAVWEIQKHKAVIVTTVPAHWQRRRHVRKYAEGELPEDRSFFFRGPHNKLNLRAYNTEMFVNIAQGIDDETWLHHLQEGDYSEWMRKGIKDEELAGEIEAIEKTSGMSPKDSRARICEAIERRYTAATRV
ncbi:MAG: HAD-IIB family hydrolase [Acidobacteriaceae bacterium]|nr:HAD-IIB family hydrolase [Acidobacteriaceae bacterium]